MGSKITRTQARRVARRSTADAAKLITVQENQIEQLKMEKKALEAVLTAVLPGVVWDVVDPVTGEVVRERMILNE